MADEHRAHKQRLQEAKEKSANRKVANLAQDAAKLVPFFDMTEEEEVEMSKQGGSRLWDAFLDRVASDKGEILVATLMGSVRYNLQVPGSDMDLVVVYLPSLEANIGLKPQPQTFKQLDNFRPDFSVHSLGHFCILLLDGDAKSIEVLFCNPSIERYIDSDWNQLQRWKRKFVTKRFIRNYTGELQGLKGLKKLKKLIDDGFPAHDINKCAYILMRLILLSKRFITGFENNTLDSSNPTWFSNDSDDHSLLMSIRRGEIDALKVQESILKEFSSLELLLASSALPESIDTESSLELEQWYLGICQNRYQISFEPAVSNIDAILPPDAIPGNLLCLYRNPCDSSLFGVYSQPIQCKLALRTPKESKLVISGDFAFNAIDSTSSPPQQYTVYEMNRFIEAIKRNELTTIISVQNKLERLYCTPAWSNFDELLPNLWTNSLLYQLCGYLSGRCKACRGEIDLLKNDKIGFLSLTSRSVSQFACQLLSVALSDDSPRPILSPESIQQLEALHKSLQTISTVSAALIDQSASSAQLNELANIAKSFTKDFISLRPILTELLWEEVKFESFETWFLACRLEAIHRGKI